MHGFGPERRPGHAEGLREAKENREHACRKIAGRDIGRADESEDRTDSLQDEAHHAGGEAALSKYKAADAHRRDSKGNGLTGAVAVEQQPGDQRHQGIGDVIRRDHPAEIVAAPRRRQLWLHHARSGAHGVLVEVEDRAQQPGQNVDRPQIAGRRGGALRNPAGRRATRRLNPQQFLAISRVYLCSHFVGHDPTPIA